METKECSMCHQIKPITEFYKYKKYYASCCHDCRQLVQKKYRESHKSKAKADYEALRDAGYHRERHKRLKESGFFEAEPRHTNQIEANRISSHNPKLALQRKARAAIKYMIRQGQLLKEPCFLCGNPKAEAHHPNYNNPRYVVFLCAACHGMQKYKAYKFVEYPKNNTD